MYIDKSKAKKHQVQYRTSIVIAVRHRWWCPSLSVVSGCQLSVIIIVAVGHGRECDRCATSRGRCTFMAEGTTSVEPAGGAEKATAARREALEPRAHGRAENGVL